MQRRSILVALAAALLALAGAAPLARADLAPPPRPLLTMQGRDSMITTAGAPSQAFFTLHNSGTRPVQVRIESVVCRLPGMRLPLQIRGVLVDSRDAGRTIEVAPGQDVPLTILLDGFSAEAERAREWSIELRASVRGERDGRVEGVATVRRGIRHPIEHGRR